MAQFRCAATPAWQIILSRADTWRTRSLIEGEEVNAAPALAANVVRRARGGFAALAATGSLAERRRVSGEQGQAARRALSEQSSPPRRMGSTTNASRIAAHRTRRSVAATEAGGRERTRSGSAQAAAQSQGRPAKAPPAGTHLKLSSHHGSGRALRLEPTEANGGETPMTKTYLASVARRSISVTPSRAAPSTVSSTASTIASSSRGARPRETRRRRLLDVGR